MIISDFTVSRFRGVQMLAFYSFLKGRINLLLLIIINTETR